MADRRTVLTIGHSNHPIDKFLELLARHGVKAVADVRSHPASRFNPQFNRERLRASLESAGVRYLFLGRELGARSADPDVYVDDRVDYDRLAATPQFQDGLVRIERSAAEPVALMCAERDPLDCHRALLICPHLEAHGSRTAHILDSGALESHDDFTARLLGRFRAGEHDLLDDRPSLLAAAYAHRSRQIAYARPKRSK
jgi:uncharacterized protein (DUF488 family)